MTYEKTCEKYIYAIADGKEINLGTTDALTRKAIIEEMKNAIREKDFDSKEEMISMLSLSEKASLTFDLSAESENQTCDIHVEDYNYAFIEFENTCKGRFYKQIRR